MDGDDASEMVEWAEGAFGITFGKEIEAVQTVGDYFDLIEEKLAAQQDGTCLLRHGFRDMRDRFADDGKPLRPTSLLADYGIADSHVRDNYPKLSTDRGDAILGAGILAAFLFTSTAIIGNWIGYFAFLGGLATFVVLLMAIARMTSEPLPVPVTVADLIRRDFDLIYPVLRKTHGVGIAADRRAVVDASIRRFSAYAGPINRGTRFY